MGLAGKITTVDLGIGTTHGVVTADDGRTFKFGVFDCGISPNDWKVGLRVSFEEGPKAGEAKHVKLFSVDPAAGKTVVTVAVDSVKYVPYHYGGDTYADGVEVFYSYRVEKGWHNCSWDEEDSPNVSVVHKKSGVESRIQSTPDLVCDGMKHSAKAVVGFGQGESIKVGTEVLVKVFLRVATGQPGSEVWKEVTDEKSLTIAEKSETAHKAAEVPDGPSGVDTSIGDWASTKPSR